jgi:hypothetical protein
MMVHRHEAIFTPAYPVSNPTGSNGAPTVSMGLTNQGPPGS